MAQLNLNNCQVNNSLSVKDVVVSNSLVLNNSNDNIAISTNSLANNTTGYSNTCLGSLSLFSNTTGYQNTAIGSYTLANNTTGYQNTANGRTSLYLNTTGYQNTGIGYQTFFYNTSGNQNTGIGSDSLQNNSTGSNNTGIGSYSLFRNTTGSKNTGAGYNVLLNNGSRLNNTAIGNNALSSNTGSNNTAIGNNALSNTTFNDVTGLGANSTVSGNNQVQLGNSTSNVYAQSALNIRSDLRDKTDIRDTILGLDFINKLRPVDFKWDVREDYVEYVVNEDNVNNNANTELKIYAIETSKSSIQVIQRPKDGSKKRNRFHHGLIAQEVKSAMDNLNVDFAGYQDHKINGGKDVLTICYQELIGPLIKSIQDLLKQLIKSNKSIQDLKDEVVFLKSQL
jgi:hypothetical protein